MKTSEKNQQEAFTLEYLFYIIKKNWLIIAASTFIGISSAYLYNKTKLPEYEIGASLLMTNTETQAPQGATEIFQGLGLFSEENSFQNNLQVIKSSPLIKNAIGNLDFQITYIGHKLLKNEELYKTSPFIVVFNQNHPQLINIAFKVIILDDQTFKIKAKSSDAELFSFTSQKVIQEIDNFKLNIVGHFGEEIQSEYYNFKLVLNENFKSNEFKTNKFYFLIHDPFSLIKSYQAALLVEPADLETSIAKISIRSTNPAKASDLITSITDEYLARDVEEKIHSAVKTIEYIDNQLGAISDSLRNAELKLQRFRTSNQVLDIAVKSGRVYDQLQELEREKGDLMVKYKYYQYINEYFEENKELSDLIAPSSMGIEDPLLNNLIQELTRLNAERTTLIENNQDKSPYLKQINIKVENLKNTISENIKYIINTTDITLQDIDSRINGLNFEINKLPTTERELLGYERKFNLNDAIYTFLLERRAEAQITKASYLPGAEIMEPADIIGSGPIAPNKKLNYILGLLLGLGLPIVFFRTKDILQNKITENTDVGNLLDLPVLGQIFSNNKKIELVVQNFPKSHVAESFRIVRTGLNYFLDVNKPFIIVITSTFGQEGKSFISNNLATSLASIDKKTVLLGFDLRKPKVFERLNIKNEIGISSYLSSQADFDAIVQSTNIKNLDVITSGPIPPNPSELIASSKTDELFDILKNKYDVILVDTPPVGILSDTYVLMDKADLNIYVVRQNQTPRRELLNIISNLKDKRIKNLCVIVNDIPLVKKSKYGYDYYEK